MKKSTRYTAVALVALTSALLLGACGGNKQATTTSSTAKTSQSSKMTKSSTKAKAKTEDKTKASSSEEMKAESSASQEAQTSKQIQPSKEEAKQDTNAPAKEATPAKADANQASSEYAKFAGTWTNDEGKTIVINADGTTPDGDHLESVQEQDGGIYTGGIRSKEGFGASFFYAPAGQSFPESMAPKEFVNTDGTDISRERIVIAQSADRMAHPFYRAN